MFSFFGVLSPLQIRLFTWRKGVRVGTDSLGNTYYRGKPRRGSGKERRWVIYRGQPEASAVPPEWHGWLHHQTDRVPLEKSAYQKPWQQAPQPNLTGTPEAYLPPGHVLKGGRRSRATGDYEAWTPPS